MRILGVIPARMAATRFPNKPMAEIQGIPMVGHCYFRSSMSSLLDEVFIATCDEIIMDYAKSIGAKCVMTSESHERATERVAEALQNIESQGFQPFDLVVMIQGDEPLVEPNQINDVIKPLLSGERHVSNTISRLKTEQEVLSPNNVKVVLDKNKNAIYMSREAIPSRKKYSGLVNYYRQLGLIAFSREALLKFVALETTPLEIIESVDMNRLLENGVPIYTVETKYEVDAVDTLEDLERVDLKMRNDKLLCHYSHFIQE